MDGLKMPDVEKIDDLPDGPSWGFWNESGDSFHCGYASEADAEGAFQDYCTFLEDGTQIPQKEGTYSVYFDEAKKKFVRS